MSRQQTQNRVMRNSCRLGSCFWYKFSATLKLALSQEPLVPVKSQPGLLLPVGGKEE